MDVRLLASVRSSSELSAPPSHSTSSDSDSAAFHDMLEDASAETSKVAGVAKQFEALIAGEVLKAARESSQGGWLGNDDDQTGELTLEMAEQAFAQALAARGSFGIAKIVTNALQKVHSKTASSGPLASPQRTPGNTDSGS